MTRLTAKSFLTMAVALAALMSGPARAEDQPAGEKLFKMQCAACHAAASGETNRQGPNLFGVLGRIAGLAVGMAYSPAFKQALDGKVWTEALLEKWLADPQEVAPDTIMLYKQADPDKRRALVDYVKTLH